MVEKGEEGGRSPMVAAEIESPRGPVPAVVHFPPFLENISCRVLPVVICSHGLLSSKDSSKFFAMGEALASSGIVAVRFDFTGCGDNANAFHPHGLIETRLGDLLAVISWVRTGGFRKTVGLSPGILELPVSLGLFGSSLGGFLSCLAAAKNPEEVTTVVSWAAPADLRFLENVEARAEWPRGPWPERMPLGTELVLPDLGSVLRVMVIHGLKDTVVPWTHAVEIYRKAGKEKRLLLVETGDHRFAHEPLRKKLTRSTVRWFAEGFGKTEQPV